MREINTGDKYLCKADDYVKGYFTKDKIYEVQIVSFNGVLFLTDGKEAYQINFEDLKNDFTDLQEETETKTPKHYQTNSIDVIDFCKLYNLNFNLGNIVKYACRVGKKENDIEDLKKVIDYAQREIKYLENK